MPIASGVQAERGRGTGRGRRRGTRSRTCAASASRTAARPSRSRPRRLATSPGSAAVERSRRRVYGLVGTVRRLRECRRRSTVTRRRSRRRRAGPRRRGRRITRPTTTATTTATTTTPMTRSRSARSTSCVAASRGRAVDACLAPSVWLAAPRVRGTAFALVEPGRLLPADETALTSAGAGREPAPRLTQGLDAAQNSPTTFPSASMSMFSPPGTDGSPGIVRISPQSGVMNPAPADSRTSRIGTVKPGRAALERWRRG